MDELVHGNPQHMFLVMLQERLDRLEDKLSNTVSAGRYYTVRVTMHERKDDLMRSATLAFLLDRVFRRREMFDPHFAAWRMGVDEDTPYHLDMILTLPCPMTRDRLEGVMSDPDTYSINAEQLDSYEFHQILSRKDSMFCCVIENDTAEYWTTTSGGAHLDSHGVPFTMSAEYLASVAGQRELRRRISENDTSVWMG